MKRRAFIAGLGTAAAWPARAFSQPLYRLGVLTGRAREEPNFVAFFEELLPSFDPRRSRCP
jgi:hypothetical protein